MIKIKLNEVEEKALQDVVNNSCDRVSFPGKLRFYHDEGELIIEIFDYNLRSM